MSSQSVTILGTGRGGNESIKARITEITSARNMVDCTEAAAEISGEIWIEGGKYDVGTNYSKRPVVIIGPPEIIELTVKINIEELENLSGEGVLCGCLGSLKVQAALSLSTGTQTIVVKEPALTEKLMFAQGDMIWTIEVENIGIFSTENVTRLELYQCASDFTNDFVDNSNGRPIECLRFLFDTIGVGSLKIDDSAVLRSNILNRLVSFLHNSHSKTYDVSRGESSYMPNTRVSDNTYNITDYVKLNVNSQVNCYDQAGAVAIISGTIGYEIHTVFVQPYGFINPTMLVGGILSNNPFYEITFYRVINNIYGPFRANHQAEDYAVVDPNFIFRTDFLNHQFNIDPSFGICYDACAGPVAVRDGLVFENYLEKSIDNYPYGYDPEIDLNGVPTGRYDPRTYSSSKILKVDRVPYGNHISIKFIV